MTQQPGVVQLRSVLERTKLVGGQVLGMLNLQPPLGWVSAVVAGLSEQLAAHYCILKAPKPVPPEMMFYWAMFMLGRANMEEVLLMVEQVSCGTNTTRKMTASEKTVTLDD